MKDKNSWAWLLFFGSLWGISEVAAGGLLYGSNIPKASVFLSVWALFILAAARGIVNRPGSSIVIGAVATLFKLANAAPFICHLAGIFLLAVAFDLTASLLLKKQTRVTWKTSLAGITGAYGGYALFAFIITYVIRYSYWVAGGLPKVMNHIFVGGSLAALLAAALVPLGFAIGLGGESLSRRRPQWVTAGTLAGIAVLWILGRFAG